MLFRQLFDPKSSTYTYLLADRRQAKAVLIDPVRDQVDRDLELIEELGLELVYVLDTHVHADHVTGAGLLRNRVGAKTVLSRTAKVDCADVLVDDGDVVTFGGYSLEVRSTPGHTYGDVSYVLADPAMVFTGDALLIRGCGRTDFQQGDAATLYRSVHDKLYSLPDETLVYPAHDYRGRTVSTIGEEKRYNGRLRLGITEPAFIEIMNGLQLAYPTQIDVALPANSQCGLTEVDVEPGPPQEDWAPIERTPLGVPELTVEWVARNEGRARIVDVREPDELVGELGHMRNAESVPLGRLREASTRWSPGEPVVTVCRSGGRSGQAAQQLEALGFEKVASMQGGMLAWRRAGLPVEFARP